MVSSITQEHSNLEIFDYELLSGKTCYTYHTLQKAQKIYPEYEIFLMLGDDQFDKFDQWKFNHQILSEFSLIVFNRTSTEKAHCLLLTLLRQRFRHWAMNSFHFHPQKSEKILKQAQTYPISFHHLYFLT